MSQLAKILPITLLALVTLSSCSSPASSNPVSHEKVIDAMSSDCVAIKDPSGSDFDWGAIKTDGILEMCLLELANNLVRVESMIGWLEGQGFSEVSSFTTQNDNVILNGIWDVNKSGNPPPFHSARSFFNRLIHKNKNYRLQIEYRDGVPVRATANYIVL